MAADPTCTRRIPMPICDGPNVSMGEYGPTITPNTEEVVQGRSIGYISGDIVFKMLLVCVSVAPFQLQGANPSKISFHGQREIDHIGPATWRGTSQVHHCESLLINFFPHHLIDIIALIALNFPSCRLTQSFAMRISEKIETATKTDKVWWSFEYFPPRTAQVNSE